MENQQSSEEMQNKLNEWNEGKDNTNQSAINNREPQQDALTIEISGFCNQIIIIHEAKVYNTECLNKSALILAISGINKNFSGDIKVDGVSIKNNRYIAKYLQSSSLILTQQTFLHPNLTLQQNLKIISRKGLSILLKLIAHLCPSSFAFDNIFKLISIHSLISFVLSKLGKS